MIDTVLQDKTHDKILEMILKGEWKEVIKSLVEDMDPWNIDLVLLSERFQYYLESLRTKDLKIPAKIILVVALIYRMKSEFFKDSKENPISEEEFKINDEENDEIIDTNDTPIEKIRIIDLPTIFLPNKKIVKTKVTLYDLLNALEKVLKSKRRNIRDDIFEFELNDYDIHEIIEETYNKILKLFNLHGKVVFSDIVEKDTPEEKLSRFQSILHLSNEERVICYQNEPFGDIEIKVVDEYENG